MSAGFSYSQQNNLEDEYHIFKYPNGTVSSEGNMRDGKPDGYWKSYYVTGVLKSEGKRRNFLLDSIWVFYTQTGDTLEKIDYVRGNENPKNDIGKLCRLLLKSLQFCRSFLSYS